MHQNLQFWKVFKIISDPCLLSRLLWSVVVLLQVLYYTVLNNPLSSGVPALTIDEWSSVYCAV